MPNQNAELLHIAVCQAVQLLNQGMNGEASSVLRQSLVDYADAVEAKTAPASPATEGHVLCKIAEVHDTKCASPATVPADIQEIKTLFSLLEKDANGTWCFTSLSRDAAKFQQVIERLSVLIPSRAHVLGCTLDSDHDGLCDPPTAQEDEANQGGKVNEARFASGDNSH